MTENQKTNGFRFMDVPVILYLANEALCCLIVLCCFSVCNLIYDKLYIKLIIGNDIIMLKLFAIRVLVIVIEVYHYKNEVKQVRNIPLIAT